MLSKMSMSCSERALASALSRTSVKVLDIIAISIFMNTTATRKVASKYMAIIEVDSVPFRYGLVSMLPNAPKL